VKGGYSEASGLAIILVLVLFIYTIIGADKLFDFQSP
jgi:hypothetical protein